MKIQLHPSTYRLPCAFVGHKYGPPVPIADTGDYECGCVRCGEEWDNDDCPTVGVRWRLPLLRTGLRGLWWTLRCLVGWHAWDDRREFCWLCFEAADDIDERAKEQGT